MAHAEPGWDLYHSFLEVLRTGSLSAASRSLGLTQPTVGRHIVALERALRGKALFTRSRTGLMPTEAAWELRPHAEAMASAAAALVRAASGGTDEVRGVVRLTASEIIGAEVLPPLLADFRSKQPAVIVELSLSNQAADLLRRDADIAVRMVRPVQKALVARKVGKTAVGLHATAGYLKARGLPQRLADLQQHTLIGFDQTPAYSRGMRVPAPISRELFAFRCDSDLGQLAALRAGFGIGFCQYGVAARSGLVPVLSAELSLDLEMWVVMHEGLKTTARMRLMFDHLVAGLGAYARTSMPPRAGSGGRG